MKEKWNQQAIKAAREIIITHATKTDPKTFTDDFIIDLLNQVERFGEVMKKNALKKIKRREKYASSKKEKRDMRRAASENV